jgi:uncharacterized glyoxalase superfamily protein PhnB
MLESRNAGFHNLKNSVTVQLTSLASIKAYLKAQGIATMPVQRKWNALVFYCTDPEGHRLEFWTNEDGSRVSLDG